MAKRAPAARAFVHIIRPNKTKPASSLKRARKKVTKGRSALRGVRGRKTRTTISLLGKSPIIAGKIAGRGIAGATNRIPARKRTVVLRGTGGRFAGRRSV